MFGVWKYHRRIARALALNRRGEVRRDGLRITHSCSCLRVQWQARLIHPWDRDLPQEAAGPLFVEQSLADTEAALERLFTSLPEIDIIELTVLDPVSKHKIMAGVVHRGDLEDARSLASIKMRLREAGVEFRLTDAHLCSLDLHDELDSFCMRAD